MYKYKDKQIIMLISEGLRMSYKFRCLECSNEFYPHWHLKGGENLIKEKCPECKSTNLKKEKINQEKLLKDLNDSLKKNSCGG